MDLLLKVRLQVPFWVVRKSSSSGGQRFSSLSFSQTIDTNYFLWLSPPAFSSISLASFCIIAVLPLLSGKHVTPFQAFFFLCPACILLRLGPLLSFAVRFLDSGQWNNWFSRSCFYAGFYSHYWRPCHSMASSRPFSVPLSAFLLLCYFKGMVFCTPFILYYGGVSSLRSWIATIGPLAKFPPG